MGPTAVRGPSRVHLGPTSPPLPKTETQSGGMSPAAWSPSLSTPRLPWSPTCSTHALLGPCCFTFAPRLITSSYCFTFIWCHGASPGYEMPPYHHACSAATPLPPSPRCRFSAPAVRHAEPLATSSSRHHETPLPLVAGLEWPSPSPHCRLVMPHTSSAIPPSEQEQNNDTSAGTTNVVRIRIMSPPPKRYRWHEHRHISPSGTGYCCCVSPSPAV